MANRILVDTGFWYAVFDKRDCHKADAECLVAKYFDKSAYEIVVPFPTMYELLRTRFVKNKEALEEIRQMFQSGRITRLDDDAYRLEALELTLLESKRNISLVDKIVKNKGLVITEYITEHQNKFERIRRITGYLVGTLDRFNDAKRSEVNDRVKHGLKETVTEL